jgi:anti-sigma factor RsiW
MSCPIAHESLSAYVDGELPPDSARVVADHLAHCARCSSEYHALLTTVSALRSGLARYAAPDMLRARIRSAVGAESAQAEAPASSPRRRIPRHWRASVIAAAAIAGVALGSGATLIAVGRPDSSRTLAGDVLASHVRSLMPDHLTDVRSSDQHNVKPWFNGRLDFSPNVPRLDDAGFPLLGGRLDYVGGRSVASVVYGRRQHIINVFSWPSTAGDASMASTAAHGYTMLHWRERGLEQWVVSDVNASELRAFALLLQRAEAPTDSTR